MIWVDGAPGLIVASARALEVRPVLVDEGKQTARRLIPHPEICHLVHCLAWLNFFV